MPPLNVRGALTRALLAPRTLLPPRKLPPLPPSASAVLQAIPAAKAAATVIRFCQERFMVKSFLTWVCVVSCGPTAAGHYPVRRTFAKNVTGAPGGKCESDRV